MNSFLTQQYWNLVFVTNDEYINIYFITDDEPVKSSESVSLLTKREFNCMLSTNTLRNITAT
ncbi:uncharacterized protein METZ01_LOCUS7777 [marine metagenome]|uniref:Uncharacterized protein n=1 Tax=marine metagenome TaxID=408172 RepID=A0A381NN10_9ZZZZ